MDPATQDTTSGDAITKRMSDTSKKNFYRLTFFIDALEATIVILAFIVALKFSSRKFTPQSLISDKLEILFADIAC